MNNEKGVTLVELLTAVVIAAAVIAAAVVLFSRVTPLIKQTQVRQVVVTQGHTAMDTILQCLRRGKARTLKISTPLPLGTSPNSRADFELQTPLSTGTTAYAIYLDNGTIFLKEYRPNGSTDPQPISTHVSMLSFTGDYRDPTTVSVSLRVDAPTDGSNDPTHISSLALPNQIVHLIDTQ